MSRRIAPEPLHRQNAANASAAKRRMNHQLRADVKVAQSTRRDAFDRSSHATWAPNSPLRSARPAHRTNTPEEFDEALRRGANYLEGDIRISKDAPHVLEMRHDKADHGAPKLSLAQWLARGRSAGVGLKLDIKETTQMPELIREVKASGVSDGRLMFNLGADEMRTFGPSLRREFPEATLALNPATDEKLEPHDVDAMIQQAQSMGGPVTFVVRADHLTDEAIKKLETVGPVSVWNDPNVAGMNDVLGEAHSLRERGVTGVVDLRHSAKLTVLKFAENALQSSKALVTKLLPL